MTVLSKIVLDYVGKHWGFLVAYAILSLFGLLVHVGIPVFIERFFRALFVDKGNGTKFAVIGLVLCYSVGEMSYFFLNMVDRVYIPNLRQTVTKELVKIIVEKMGKRHTDLDTSEILSKMVKLPFVLGDLVGTVRSTILHNVYAFFGVAIFMTVMVGWRAGLATLCFGGLIALCLTWGFVSTLNSSNDLDRAYDISYMHYADVFNNVLSVFAFSGRNIEMLKADDNHVEVLEALRVSFWKLSVSRLAAIITLGLYAVAMVSLMYGVYKRGGEAARRVGSAGMVMVFFIGQINNFLSHLSSLAYDTSVLRRLDMFISEQILEGDTSVCPSLSDQTQKQQLQKGYTVSGDLEFSHPGSTSVFTVEGGDRVLKVGKIYQLKGEIGAGKSTFLSLMSGKYTPSKGHILLDGKPVCGVTMEDLAKMILYIPQVPSLFNRTVLENIIYPDVDTTINEKIITEITDQMILVGLKTVDLNLRLVHNGENVSGGQRQMIYMLRLWYTATYKDLKFKAVLLDEPFSSIGDNNTGNVTQPVAKMIQKIGEGKVTVMISHVDNHGLTLESAGVVRDRVWGASDKG